MTYEIAITFLCGIFIGFALGIAIMTMAYTAKERGLCERRTDGEDLEQEIFGGQESTRGRMRVADKNRDYRQDGKWCGDDLPCGLAPPWLRKPR